MMSEFNPLRDYIKRKRAYQCQDPLSFNSGIWGSVAREIVLLIEILAQG